MSVHTLITLLFVRLLALNADTSPIVTIPLDKQYVPVQRNNVTVAYKTAYFGKVFLGLPKPQNFTVVFDTGSGHFFLPSAGCDTETCRMHRRYNRTASATAVDIDHDGHAVDHRATERDQVAIVYGTGEIVGEFVRETICLGNQPSSADAEPMLSTTERADCTKVRVILATEMTREPFWTFKFDGVLGLGLESLALDPEFSFFGQMSRLNNLTEARFGYFLSRNDRRPSEISFGGHDARRVASELQWAPVERPELGYWQGKILSVTVAGKALPMCQESDCLAIADTGTSLIGVPKQVVQNVHLQLARKVPDDPAEIDCREFPGPDLVFELEGGVTLTLGPEDYSRATAMRVLQKKSNKAQVICRASLLPVEQDPALNPNTWILGEPVLRKYYTAYDWRRKQIGFAPAVQPPDSDEEPTHLVIDAPPTEAPIPAVVHV
mmetsp:Transcript_122998/g.274656  ORF Transcript_122998/g.274656 Transcript_122998/m.274656 type:complete len:437 (+) Transcript_122998:100-1410(+)